MVTVIFCRRLQEVTSLHAISHVYGLILSVLYPGGSFSFLFSSISFSYKHELETYICISAIEVKNRRKTIGIEEILRVIMRREKGERTVDIRRNIRLAYGIAHKMRDNVDRINPLQTKRICFI
jgi:hypothetical protein